MTTTVYDANGNVIQTTTPDGMVTDSVYNAQGQVTYTDDPHLPGEPTNGTLTEYDQDGNVVGTEELANMVITVTKTGVDVGTSVLTSVGAILSTTSTNYDAAGRVTQTVDASGMVTNNTYDDVGNLISTHRDRQRLPANHQRRRITHSARSLRRPMPSATRRNISTTPLARSPRRPTQTARR